MAHGSVKIDELDKTPVGAKALPARTLAIAAAVAGAVLLITSLFGSNAGVVGGGWTRMSFAYLIGYAFFFALTVGALALVVLTTLFRAGWVVAVRRIPETFAANFLFVGLLGLPILFVALFGNGMLYPWSMDQQTFGKELHEAEEFLHHLHAEHAEAEEAHAAAESAGYYVAVEHAEGDHAHDHAGHGHDDAHADHAAPGAAYPENKERAQKIQHANYMTLLGYMLDYKRFGGTLEYKDPETGEVLIAQDALVPAGKGWLWYSPLAFAVRMVLYLAVFATMGVYYWKKSVAQDASGDPDLTTRREWWAPPATVVFALITTFFSFDLLMSLDPAWYSTMFGVIFFANAFLAGIATTILVCMMLKKRGLLKAVNVEHFHDLGKLLFAMTFFWGYTTFSQFMLIWYASLPETTYWFEIRGATTVQSAPQFASGWSWIILILLFGHLLVPFGFLLSRHVKRNMTCLTLASVWLLLMVYLDLFWYIMPVYSSPKVVFGLPEIGAVLLVGGAVLWKFIGRFKQHAPVAYNDPRMHESVQLDTNVWAPIYH